ncbi:NAD(P)/FAD-dependent oxidoreductase [Streptomyces sp. B8F3]|uniref:NAD(P)/FAD-dependent oxidoreductase n=1 Tax=unclassified Streptomyces TaxID=2593676 RepID=UPI00325CA094
MGSKRGHHDVIVVGAGAAGLACAFDIAAAGQDVRVLEASDAVGGRMRTDHRDGFLLDRGFQVLNTSYPQLRRRASLPALRLRPFTPSVLSHTRHGRLRYGDPSRRPRDLPRLARPGRHALRDGAGLAAVSLFSALAPPRALRARTERTTSEELGRRGITGDLLENFLHPFLSGVFLDDRLETSSRVFHMVWRSFLRGTVTLPAAGIGAVPAHLASLLPPGTVRFDHPVRELTATGVLSADGRELDAPAVVVATEAETAARLLPHLTVPPTRTVCTYYYAAPDSPLREPTLLLDARRRFLHTCVPSQVVPGYAPRGHALVCASVLGTHTRQRALALREALAEAYETDTSRWEEIARYSIPGALPAMVPPWPLSRTGRAGAGRYVCGDHRATGSVQGALASGARAAREVLASGLR